MNHLKRLLFSSILCILLSFISCDQQEYICVCYIYENGVQTRIDESVIIQDGSSFSHNAGNECESKSYFTDDDNYSICTLSYDGDLP